MPDKECTDVPRKRKKEVKFQKTCPDCWAFLDPVTVAAASEAYVVFRHRPTPPPPSKWDIETVAGDASESP